MENQEIITALLRIEQKIDSVLTPSGQEYYSVKEVERILRISRSTFDRYVKIGQIETINVGRKIKVHKSEIEKIQANGFNY